MNLNEGRVYLGHLGSIPLYIHWTFVFLLLMVFGGTNFQDGLSIEMGLMWMMALLIAIVLHELGHGLAAKVQGAFGITITLWAMGGLCSSTRDPLPRRELIILAAGPAVSLLLWWVSGLALTLVANAPPGAFGGLALQTKLATFLYISQHLNMLLFVFNILPIFPLDGGQIMFNLGLLVTRRHDLVRKFTLACAFAGAFAYLAWRHQTTGTVQPYSVIMMGWLVFNAFTYLR